MCEQFLNLNVGKVYYFMFTVKQGDHFLEILEMSGNFAVIREMSRNSPFVRELLVECRGKILLGKTVFF